MILIKVQGEAGDWYEVVVVTGSIRGSLGASLVPLDWQVRVFRSSGIVDIPSDHLSAWNIPLSGYMDRRSHYTLQKNVLEQERNIVKEVPPMTDSIDPQSIFPRKDETITKNADS